MSSVSDGASYSYNAAGEMIDDDGTTLGWSAFGKAVSVDQGVGGNSVSFAYGPDDARVEKNVVAGGQSDTVLYFEGAERLTEGPYTAIRRTITLADLTFIDTGGAGSHVLYPVTDNLGSTIALGAANGSLAQGMSYGPFGRRETAGWAGYMSQSEALTINTTETDRSYTGQEGLDAVGLMDYNARLYDPSLGRFLSVDPKIADPQGTQSINPYSYVGNNPLNATDPTGESKCVAGRPCSDPLAGQFDGLMAINVSDATVSGSIMQNGVAIASFSVSGEAAVGMLADMTGKKAMNAGNTLGNSTTDEQGGVAPARANERVSKSDGDVANPEPATLSGKQRAELNKAINSANKEVEKIASKGGFHTAAAAAQFLHNRLDPISRQLGVEIGANIYKGSVPNSVTVFDVRTDSDKNSVDLPKGRSGWKKSLIGTHMGTQKIHSFRTSVRRI